MTNSKNDTLVRTAVQIPLIKAHGIEKLTEQVVTVCKTHNLIVFEKQSNNVKLPFVSPNYVTTLIQAKRDFVMYFKDKIYLLEQKQECCIKSRRLSDKNLENLFDIVCNRIKSDLYHELYKKLFKTGEYSQKIHILREYCEYADECMLSILDFVKWLHNAGKSKQYTVCPCKQNQKYLYCTWHNYTSWQSAYSKTTPVSPHVFWVKIRVLAKVLPEFIAIHNNERATKLIDGTTCSKIFTINRLYGQNISQQENFVCMPQILKHYNHICGRHKTSDTTVCGYVKQNKNFLEKNVNTGAKND